MFNQIILVVKQVGGGHVWKSCTKDKSVKYKD